MGYPGGRDTGVGSFASVVTEVVQEKSDRSQ